MLISADDLIHNIHGKKKKLNMIKNEFIFEVTDTTSEKNQLRWKRSGSLWD